MEPENGPLEDWPPPQTSGFQVHVNLPGRIQESLIVKIQL